MTQASQHEHSAAQRERARKGVRRTAWLFGGIAAVIYVGFMLIGVFGK